MNILFLGYDQGLLIEFLKQQKDVHLFQTDQRIALSEIKQHQFDFAISYGYRYVISPEIIQYFNDKIINLHIAYLPWNKGADPNFWSFISETRKGVTVHIVTEKIDIGPILLQREVFLTDNETLRTSYEKLQNEIQKLLIDNWDAIKAQKIPPKPQVGQGSFHSSKEAERFKKNIPDLYDIKIPELKKRVAQYG